MTDDPSVRCADTSPRFAQGGNETWASMNRDFFIFFLLSPAGGEAG